MPNILYGTLSGSSSIAARITPLTATSNGEYNPPEGFDGFAPVHVQVPTPTPVISPLIVTQNGVYPAPSGIDGFDPVTVNVPTPVPVLDDITITQNGHYTPPTGTDGYDDITVNVQQQTTMYLNNKLVGTEDPNYFTVNLDNNLVANKWYLLAINDSAFPGENIYGMFYYNGSNIDDLYIGTSYKFDITQSTVRLDWWSGSWRNIWAKITEVNTDQFYL